MLDALIRFSLKNRLLILTAGIVISIYGIIKIREIPIDVFPDLTRPTVTLLTEAQSLAAEEVEFLVTVPLENLLRGLPGIERVRSVSSTGLSVIYLEFSWDSDIYLSRQLVSERLLSASSVLPQDIRPQLGPISSLMGQIQQIAITSPEKTVSAMDLRTLADWDIRPRLLAIKGVAQILSIGGEVKQYQIILNSAKLREYQITVETLNEALDLISANGSGGLSESAERSLLIRTIGSALTIDDLKKSYIAHHFGRPVLVEDIAEVKIGHRFKVGDGGYNGSPAVILSVQKQPSADTIEISRQIDKVISQSKQTLPAGVVIDTEVFQQADFIQRSIDGVVSKLKSGSILVFIVLLVFLANIRMSLITVTAIPLSFCITFIIMNLFGLTVNTMTLGGLAIAIGELVDDSIVDVENIYRRIVERSRDKLNTDSLLKIIFEASSEVRNSIFLSTLIIALIFLPIFQLTGLEGRLFLPLGIAYLTALGASLVVSLTLTPVLSYYLFRKNWQQLQETKDTKVLSLLKTLEVKLLRKTLNRPKIIVTIAALCLIVTVVILGSMGRNFLPPFNEGTALLTVVKDPNISLSHASQMGFDIERTLKELPEIKSISRKTGRSEEDEHIMPASVSEIDISFSDPNVSKTDVYAKIRAIMDDIPDVQYSIGQQLSHLMDHMLSGVSAELAIKIFADDLAELRKLGVQAEELLKTVPGLVDLRLEQQELVPQLKIFVLRSETAQSYLKPGEIIEHLNSLLYGNKRGVILENDRFFELISLLPQEQKGNKDYLNGLVLKTLPNGRNVTVYDVADVYEGLGANEILREDSKRRIMVSANLSGRDQTTVVKEIRELLEEKLELKNGSYFTIGGQFEAQETATQKMILFSLLAVFLLFIILYMNFHSWVLSFQIILSLPLATVGGVLLLYFLEGSLSVASMIGFIALIGIASRNAIMLIGHYLHLLKYEGEKFNTEMIIRGTQERLAPVLMTALTAIFAMMPLLFAKGESGSEILYPVAVVMIGGLMSSTFLDIFVTPVLFYTYAKKSVENLINRDEAKTQF